MEDYPKAGWLKICFPVTFQCWLPDLRFVTCCLMAMLVVLEIQCTEMKYRVEQKLLMYDIFVWHSLWRKCCRTFHTGSPGSTVLMWSSDLQYCNRITFCWIGSRYKEILKVALLVVDKKRSKAEKSSYFGCSSWIGKKMQFVLVQP